MLNIVTGGDPVEQARFGDHLSHDERYARTDEFMAIMRLIFAGGGRLSPALGPQGPAGLDRGAARHRHS